MTDKRIQINPDIVEHIIFLEESGIATQCEVKAGMEIVRLRSQIYDLKNKTHPGYEEVIEEALYDAICDGDGRARQGALTYHLDRHGLRIVPKENT